MEDLKTKAEQLTSDVGDLLESYYQLTLVNITEKTTRALTSTFSVVVICIFCICVLLLMGIGLSVWLGDVLDNSAAGYFLTGAIYIVLLLLFLAFRKKLVFPFLRDYFVRKINL